MARKFVALPYHGWKSLEVVDLHAAGDVSRVVFDGVKALPGRTPRDKAHFLASEADGLRRLLLSPPRGDPSMSVNLLVPPGMPGARAGHIIMEAMGYPGFSGSNTICTATALVERGDVPGGDGSVEFTLEAPAGATQVKVDCHGGRAVAVTYEAGPAYVVERGLCAEVAGYGPVFYDLVWSGVVYAVVNAAAHGFRLVAEEAAALAAFSRALLDEAGPRAEVTHPSLGPSGPLSFVLLAGALGFDGQARRCRRTAVYVHPDVICRSPTGTGTSAQIALLAADGALDAGDCLQTVSPGGTSFTGTLRERVRVGPYEGVRTAITGRAYTLARLRVTVDPDDPMFEDAGLSCILA